MKEESKIYVSLNQEILEKYEKLICEYYKIESDYYLNHILREIWNSGARIGVDSGLW